MGFLSVLSFAHRCAGDRLRPGDIAVDATAGTGADTLFLCEAVGPKGTVFAFDIQQEALDRTAGRIARLGAAAPDVKLVLRSHADMREVIPADMHGRVRAVMFNLGYLPGGDTRIITRTPSTLAAMEAALSLLAPGGVMTAVLYPGHEGGREEAEAVERWAAALPAGNYRAIVYRFVNRMNEPPYVVAVERIPTSNTDVKREGEGR